MGPHPKLKFSRGLNPWNMIEPTRGPNNEVRLYLGNLTVNGWQRNPGRRWWQFWKPNYIKVHDTMSWTKEIVAPVTYTFQTPWEDKLLKDFHVEVERKDNV